MGSINRDSISASQQQAAQAAQQGQPSAQAEPKKASRMQTLFTQKVHVGDVEKRSASVVAKETGFSKREVVQLHKEGKLAEIYQKSQMIFGEKKTVIQMAKDTGISAKELRSMDTDTRKDTVESELLARETGYTPQEIGKMTHEERLELREYASDNKEIADNTGNSIKQLKQQESLAEKAQSLVDKGGKKLSPEQLESDTGFSYSDLVELNESGQLTQDLYNEAVQMRNEQAALAEARKGVEGAMGRFFENKNVTDAKKELRPEEYKQAYNGIEGLAMQHIQHPENNQGQDLVAFRGDRFRILDMSNREYLAEGSFGSVSKVVDVASNQYAIVKVAKKDPELLARGAQVLTLLHGGKQHLPGIMDEVQVEGWDQLVGDLYEKGELTSDHIAGMSKDERQRMVQDTLAGLAHAHGQGVFHRDIKPGNMFVSGSNRVVLADWDGAVIPSQDPSKQTSVSTAFYQIDNDYLDIADSNTDTPQARELLAKVDALALGFSYIEGIVGQTRIDQIVGGHLNQGYQTEDSIRAILNDSSLWSDLEGAGLTQDQIAIIKLMIQPDRSERITPESALKLLKSEGAAVAQLNALPPSTARVIDQSALQQVDYFLGQNRSTLAGWNLLYGLGLIKRDDNPTSGEMADMIVQNKESIHSYGFVETDINKLIDLLRADQAQGGAAGQVSRSAPERVVRESELNNVEGMLQEGMVNDAGWFLLYGFGLIEQNDQPNSGMMADMISQNKESIQSSDLVKIDIDELIRSLREDQARKDQAAGQGPISYGSPQQEYGEW